MTWTRESELQAMCMVDSVLCDVGPVADQLAHGQWSSYMT